MASPVSPPPDALLKAPTHDSLEDDDSDSSDSFGSDSEDESDPSDELQNLNSKLQAHFAEEMQDVAEKRRHAKVSVLLIQWEVEHEGFMDTRDEVNSSGSFQCPS